jgi:hypothetical protein
MEGREEIFQYDKDFFTRKGWSWELHPPYYNFLGPYTKFNDRMTFNFYKKYAKGFNDNYMIPFSRGDFIAFKHDLYYFSDRGNVRIVADAEMLYELLKEGQEGKLSNYDSILGMGLLPATTIRLMKDFLPLYLRYKITRQAFSRFITDFTAYIRRYPRIPFDVPLPLGERRTYYANIYGQNGWIRQNYPEIWNFLNEYVHTYQQPGGQLNVGFEVLSQQMLSSALLAYYNINSLYEGAFTKPLKELTDESVELFKNYMFGAKKTGLNVKNVVSKYEKFLNEIGEFKSTTKDMFDIENQGYFVLKDNIDKDKAKKLYKEFFEEYSDYILYIDEDNIMEFRNFPELNEEEFNKFFDNWDVIKQDTRDEQETVNDVVDEIQKNKKVNINLNNLFQNIKNLSKANIYNEIMATREDYLDFPLRDKKEEKLFKSKEVPGGSIPFPQTEEEIKKKEKVKLPFEEQFDNTKKLYEILYSKSFTKEALTRLSAADLMKLVNYSVNKLNKAGKTDEARKLEESTYKTIGDPGLPVGRIRNTLFKSFKKNPVELGNIGIDNNLTKINDKTANFILNELLKKEVTGDLTEEQEFILKKNLRSGVPISEKVEAIKNFTKQAPQLERELMNEIIRDQKAKDAEIIQPKESGIPVIPGPYSKSSKDKVTTEQVKQYSRAHYTLEDIEPDTSIKTTPAGVEVIGEQEDDFEGLIQNSAQAMLVDFPTYDQLLKTDYEEKLDEEYLDLFVARVAKINDKFYKQNVSQELYFDKEDRNGALQAAWAMPNPNMLNDFEYLSDQSKKSYKQLYVYEPKQKQDFVLKNALIPSEKETELSSSRSYQNSKYNDNVTQYEPFNQTYNSEKEFQKNNPRLFGWT